jgi:predicted dehydrogenase
MAQKPELHVGLVGSGFMGRCHANAFRSVGGLFDLPLEPVADMLADISAAVAATNAATLGFQRSTGDWRDLCADPAIGIVAVTAPNVLHEPIVMAALAAGKHVYCEKPLSSTLESARRMTEAAQKAGVVTMVGFNFLRNPMIRLARELIEAGEIGEVVSFRGRHAENYMADPDVAHSFRTDPDGGGALADIGSHIISMARYLLGPITHVTGQSRTVHKTRPIAPGSAERGPVLVDDATFALVEFECGAAGTVEANWAASGRTMDLSWEITGTRGAIAFTQERMNELLLCKGTGVGRASGFTRIEAGPSHPPYGNFCPAPGHHLGFNDLKVIEVAQLIGAISGGTNPGPDFQEALEVQKVVSRIAASCQNSVGSRSKRP